MELIKGGKNGAVSFVNDFNFKGVKRFYLVSILPGEVRAWHGHKKEAKYVYVVTGSVLVGGVKLPDSEVSKFVLSDNHSEVLYIPPGYANGVKGLTGAKVIFFSTSTLEESLADDYRFPPERWKL